MIGFYVLSKNFSQKCEKLSDTGVALITKKNFQKCEKLSDTGVALITKKNMVLQYIFCKDS